LRTLLHNYADSIAIAGAHCGLHLAAVRQQLTYSALDALRLFPLFLLFFLLIRATSGCMTCNVDITPTGSALATPKNGDCTLLEQYDGVPAPTTRTAGMAVSTDADADAARTSWITMGPQPLRRSLAATAARIAVVTTTAATETKSTLAALVAAQRVYMAALRQHGNVLHPDAYTNRMDDTLTFAGLAEPRQRARPHLEIGSVVLFGVAAESQLPCSRVCTPCEKPAIGRNASAAGSTHCSYLHNDI
jgi:hypothetical protein